MTTGRGLVAGRLSATRGPFGARELAQGCALTIEGHFGAGQPRAPGR